METWDISKAQEMLCCDFRCFGLVEDSGLQDSCPATRTHTKKRKNPPNTKQLLFCQCGNDTKGKLCGIEQKQTSQWCCCFCLPTERCWPMCPQRGFDELLHARMTVETILGKPAMPLGHYKLNFIPFFLPCYSSTKLPVTFRCFSIWALLSCRPSYLQQWPWLCINHPRRFITASMFPHGNLIYSPSMVPLHSPSHLLWI